MAGRNGEVLTLVEEPDGSPRDEGTVAQAMEVLGWFGCQRGNHRWKFVDEDSYGARACVRCERTEHTEHGVDGRVWVRDIPEQAARIRKGILRRGDYWDDHDDWDDWDDRGGGWNPDWDDHELQQQMDYWDFRASLPRTTG